MFGMIKNSLFGNTEKTEYKLLSSETKVRAVWTELSVSPETHSSASRCVSAQIADRFGKGTSDT